MRVVNDHQVCLVAELACAVLRVLSPGPFKFWDPGPIVALYRGQQWRRELLELAGLRRYCHSDLKS
jgi:hypothetical protein